MTGNIRFVVDGQSTFSEYPLQGHVPRVGESVCFDGSDQRLPCGIYEVTNVASHVRKPHGLHLVVIDVRTIYATPQKPRPHDQWIPCAQQYSSSGALVDPTDPFTY